MGTNMFSIFFNFKNEKIGNNVRYVILGAAMGIFPIENRHFSTVGRCRVLDFDLRISNQMIYPYTF